MTLTVLEAGRLVGRSKSHIFRAIKSGALSADRDEAGAWRIDRAELARVFPLAQSGAPDDLPRHGDGAVVAQLEARLAEALDQVHDLRERLTESEKERRATAERLTALLSDQRAAPAPIRRWPWLRFGR